MSDEEIIESPVFEKVPVTKAAPEKPTADKEIGEPATDSGAVDGEKATAEAADKEESAADGEQSIEAAPSAVENAEEAAIGDSPDAPAVGPVKRKVDEAAAKDGEAGATPEKKTKLH
ncbi:myristoylated alanine-rich C-kinase substrate-like [Drosophila suzukii]|uniref:Myristoylated alanine-rich C-kinase substrate-like n=1 Tax=Drosophila suzukii TaxID=28584 RepID=A0ABM4TTX7_DROSZ